ncbi:MAG TPA: hypothetical protein VGO11_15600 [Chthoniobacteraceae bacterium]|jgi:hypothetical protein|nr:hypothetical protein [Chthoniobacteraceae bacterium]
MSFPRRLLSFALIVLAMATVARAQQQEEKLMDRLKRGPNSNLSYDTNQSAFGSRSASNSTTNKVAKTGDFSTRSFLAREFISKPYAGTEKRSWFANLFFPAKSANTSGKYEIPNAAQPYGTKEAPTKDARDSGKTAATNAFASTDLQYLKRNRFDASIKPAPSQEKTVGYTGDLRPMSIDDVRELLNKNK